MVILVNEQKTGLPISRYLYWFGRKLHMIVAPEGKYLLMSIFSYDLVRER